MVAQGDRRGYQHLLDEFWAEAEDQGVPLPSEEPVSAAAFCKARKGLKPELVHELIHRVGDRTDRTLEDGEGKWQGRRLFAVDGTSRTVRRSPELWDYFGAAEGSNYPQATVSILSDVLTGVTYDVWIGPYASCERTAMLQHLERLNEGDVIIMDRGYPSSEVLDALDRLRIDFIIRVPASGTWAEVEHFAASDHKDRLLVIPLRKTIEGGKRAMTVRAVNCKRAGQEPMILLTSLSRNDASVCKLDELYHMRWAVEETYKLPKGLYLNQRQMHSMSVEGVEQEILALQLFISLARTMRRLSVPQASVDDERDLSQKAAILATGRFIASLALAPVFNPTAWRKAVTRILAWIARRLDKRRPDRHYQRRSFQPRQRWNAQGRVGSIG